MGVEKIREKTATELESKLKSLKEELFNLRFQNAINQLDNTMRIKAVRKDIARIKTVLREMELGIEVKKDIVLASDKIDEKEQSKQTKKAAEDKPKKTTRKKKTEKAEESAEATKEE